MGWHCNHTILINDEQAFKNKMASYFHNYSKQLGEKISKHKDLIDKQDFQKLFTNCPQSWWSAFVCMFIVSDIDFLSKMDHLYDCQFAADSDYIITEFISGIEVPSNIKTLDVRVFASLPQLEEISGCEGVIDCSDYAFIMDKDFKVDRFKDLEDKIVLNTNNKFVKEKAKTYASAYIEVK